MPKNRNGNFINGRYLHRESIPMLSSFLNPQLDHTQKLNLFLEITLYSNSFIQHTRDINVQNQTVLAKAFSIGLFQLGWYTSFAKIMDLQRFRPSAFKRFRRLQMIPNREYNSRRFQIMRSAHSSVQNENCPFYKFKQTWMCFHFDKFDDGVRIILLVL